MGNSCNKQNQDHKDLQEVVNPEPIVNFDLEKKHYSKDDMYYNMNNKKSSQETLPVFQSQIKQNVKHSGIEEQLKNVNNKTTLRMNDGSEYYGEVKNDLPDGHGKQIWTNGDEFVGYYLAGKKNGIGKFYKKDGYSFHGNYLDNRISGFGVMNFPNGDVYKGNFQKGQFEGEGELLLADGSLKKGTFSKGKFVNS
jgi:hypothetical protein